MKRLVSLVLVGFMALWLVACCGDDLVERPNNETANSDDVNETLEASPSNSISPVTVEIEMVYDNNNYCRFMLEDEEDGINAIGVCQFDGLDPQLETVRSLAFTTYCVQNANVFSNGNLTMLYYSGEDNGFARYENGEIGLSDFPDGWNIYASDVTQDQIEEEMQNIIDNID